MKSRGYSDIKLSGLIVGKGKSSLRGVVATLFWNESVTFSSSNKAFDMKNLLYMNCISLTTCEIYKYLTNQASMKVKMLPFYESECSYRSVQSISI